MSLISPSSLTQMIPGGGLNALGGMNMQNLQQGVNALNGIDGDNLQKGVNALNGLDVQHLTNQVGQLQDVGKSFEDVYNLGLNSLRSSVGESSGLSSSRSGGIGGANVSFDGVRDFIAQVDAKSDHAAQLRSEVVAGDSASLHRAMIASEEASVSFTLLLEMRNKLLETYQELMRMQV